MVWTFLLKYVCNINILGFILYSVVFCNYSHIYSKTFSFACGFFSQWFPHKFGVFFFFLVSYFIIIPLISTIGIKAIKNFFYLVNGNYELRNSLVGSQYKIFDVVS